MICKKLQTEQPAISKPPTADHLAAELDRLGILFLRSDPADEQFKPLAPEMLLAGLAASSEARLRLALIPLLLARPDYATALPAALNGLPAAAQVVLRCYATAAVLLQAQYTARLNALFGPQPCLPDWFSADLGVPKTGPVAERLAALAECQRRLSGQTINWSGTYAHGAESLLRFTEQQQRWAATLIKA